MSEYCENCRIFQRTLAEYRRQLDVREVTITEQADALEGYKTQVTSQIAVISSQQATITELESGAAYIRRTKEYEAEITRSNKLEDTIDVLRHRLEEKTDE